MQPRYSGGEDVPHDRGVSEMVGFILSFSVVILAVGLLYTAGVTSLMDLQGGQQLDNAERVMVAVSDGFSELREGQAPKRAGALDLDVGASLAVTNETRIDVAVNGAGFTESYTVRSLVYEYERTTVAYESGAVIRTTDGVSTLVADPPEFHCGNGSDTALLSVLTLTETSDRRLSGGTATITGIQQASTLRYPTTRGDTGIENVTVTVTSPRSDAWHDGLEATGWTDPNDDGTYSCENVDRAFVRNTVVQVRFVS